MESGIRKEIGTLGRTIGLLGVILSCLTCVGAHAGESVTLHWQPNGTPDTAGYALYSGVHSGTYSTRQDVGTNTTATISGLKEGQTNYFVVTAYNFVKVEGPASSEIAYLVPGVLRLTASGKNGAALTFPVAPGHWYDVQATGDLKVWSSIGQTVTATNNTWMTFQDTNTAYFPKRFYRLVLH
jgi:hypothetical protein